MVICIVDVLLTPPKKNLSKIRANPRNFFFSSAKSEFFLKKFIFFEKSDEKNEIGVDPAEKRQKVHFVICNRSVGAF